MSLANFKVFSQYAYGTRQELLAYNVNLFNGATKNGFVLSAGSNQGDFSDKTLYARIAGLVRRRDAYATGAVTPKELAMLQETSVKVAGAAGPVQIDSHWWSWIQRDPKEAGVVLGKQLAEEDLADKVAVGVKAFVAALKNVGATVVSDGTGGNATLAKLLAGASLFGDRAQQIGCWVIHSKPMFDIWGTTLANSAELFKFGDVMVMQDGFGRPFVVTDQPDLVYTSSGTKYRTLGLTPGAVMVEENSDWLANEDIRNGDESIRTTWQAQWTFNVAVKGFAWDKTNGGKSPSNAALATGTNWDRYATETKDLAGVIVETT